MRLSAEPKSPFFYGGKGIAGVLVDGVLITACVECDTTEGWADVLYADDAGYMLTPGQTYRLTGHIDVVYCRSHTDNPTIENLVAHD